MYFFVKLTPLYILKTVKIYNSLFDFALNHELRQITDVHKILSSFFFFPFFFHSRIGGIGFCFFPFIIKYYCRCCLFRISRSAFHLLVIVFGIIFFAAFVIVISTRSGKTHLQIFSRHICTYKIVLLNIIFKQTENFI